VYFYIDLPSTLTSGAGRLQANGDFGDQSNPKDQRNQPVRNLPPTLRLGQKDRAKYLAIGESDRMTLKFTKPTTEAQAH
jgi:predicted methyltransferase